MTCAPQVFRAPAQDLVSEHVELAAAQSASARAAVATAVAVAGEQRAAVHVGEFVLAAVVDVTESARVVAGRVVAFVHVAAGRVAELVPAAVVRVVATVLDAFDLGHDSAADASAARYLIPGAHFVHRV